MSKTTPYGFLFGNLLVSRMWEHKGATCVRVENIVSGKYFDIQTSPKGRKQYVSVGAIGDKDQPK